MSKQIDRSAAFQELRDLVVTYLEGSADAARATELLAMFEPQPSMLSDTFWECLKNAANALANESIDARESRERMLFGCTAASIDEALARKEPRDVAMYAMGTLSNAQDLIERSEYEGFVEWSVPTSHRANTIRQLMNIAKYAIDKAIP